MSPDEARDVAAQCRDWICLLRENASDGGKLTDFIIALDVVLGEVANLRTQFINASNGCAEWGVAFAKEKERADKAEQERDDMGHVLADLNDDGVDYEDDLIAATERDTAERVAAWLEQNIEHLPPGLDVRTTLTAAVEGIRDHAWRDAGKEADRG